MIIIIHRAPQLYRRFVFLDRDGVVNTNREGYVRTIADVNVFGNAIEAVRLLTVREIGIVFVTNQQAIGKGIITMEEAFNIHQYILDALDVGNSSICLSLMCPHLVSEGCSCRKPQTGMLRQAGILVQPARFTHMMGDARSDVLAARDFGVEPLLVNKREEAGSVREFSGILEAVRYIIQEQ